MRRMGHNDHVPVSIITTTQNIFIQTDKNVKLPKFTRFGGAAPFSHNTAAPETFLDKLQQDDIVEPFSIPNINEERKKVKNVLSWDPSSPKKDKGYIVKMGSYASSNNDKPHAYKKAATQTKVNAQKAKKTTKKSAGSSPSHKNSAPASKSSSE